MDDVYAFLEVVHAEALSERLRFRIVGKGDAMDVSGVAQPTHPGENAGVQPVESNRTAQKRRSIGC